MRNVFTVVGVMLFVAGTSLIFFFTQERKSLDFSANAAAAVVPFTPLARGVQGVIGERVNYAITSPKEMKTLWEMLKVAGTPPVVDFNKEMVVAVVGTQTAVGDGIAVTKVEDSEARTVYIKVQYPDRNCAPARLGPSPYEIVSMPHTTLPLAHKDEQVLIPCTKQ